MNPDFAYLLFIDLFRLKVNEDFNDYEKREPGYTQAMVDAYMTALTDKQQTGTLSPDLIKLVHSKAMQWHKDPDYQGQYRNQPNNIPTYPMTVSGSANICYHYSEQRMFDYLSKYYDKHHDVTQFGLVNIEEEEKKGNIEGFVIAKLDKQTGLYHCVEMLKGKRQFLSFNKEGLDKKIKQLLQKVPHRTYVENNEIRPDIINAKIIKHSLLELVFEHYQPEHHTELNLKGICELMQTNSHKHFREFWQKQSIKTLHSKGMTDDEIHSIDVQPEKCMIL